MENKNLEFWNSVEKTDPEITKKVAFGRKFTTIDAYHQIKNATAKWGMYGKTWGLRDLKFSPITDTGLLISNATFWYPDGEFPIASCIKMWTEKADKDSVVDRIVKRVDDECVKKVVTDMITKALSFVGFNADVFLGKFDDNRYLSQLKEEFNSEEKKEYPDYIKKPKEKTLFKDTKTTGVKEEKPSEEELKRRPNEEELRHFKDHCADFFKYNEDAFNEWLEMTTEKLNDDGSIKHKGKKNVNEIKTLKQLRFLYVAFKKYSNRKDNPEEE